MATSPFAAAIARLEGFGVPGAIPTQANNPGDLELGDIGYGVSAAAGGNSITNFPTIEAGWNALENQLNKIVSGSSPNYPPGTSVQQALTTYSGSPSYAQNAANILGVNPGAPVSTLAPLTASGGGILPNLLSGDINPFTSGPGAQQTVNATPWLGSRGIVLVLGIITFAAGLFSFKATQTVIQTGTNVVKKTSKLAASSAVAAGTV